MVWCLFWWVLVYDSPVHHPRITEEEKQHILNAMGDKVQHSTKENKVKKNYNTVGTYDETQGKNGVIKRRPIPSSGCTRAA